MGEKSSYPAYEALNDRDKMLVSELLTGPHRFNQTRAFRAVIEDMPDEERTTHPSSDSSWRVRASEFFRRPAVRAAVFEMLCAGRGLDPEFIRQRLTEIAVGGDVADFEDYITGQKTLKQLRDEGFDTKQVRVAKVTATKEGKQYQLEMVDPMPAIAQGIRVLGMAVEKQQIELNATGFENMSDEELRQLDQALQKANESTSTEKSAVDSDGKADVDAGGGAVEAPLGDGEAGPD